MTTTPKGKLVIEYLKRFPSYSSHRLASMIISSAPGVFANTEDCRSMVRYYRGASGTNKKNKIAKSSIIQRVIIPESDVKIWEPLELSQDDFPIIAGGDAHVPYHDQDILEMFIERAIEIKAKTIMLMGDWWDCYQLSKFLTDPRKRHTKDEAAILKDIFSKIREALPKARIIYKLGNHEERLIHYLMRQAPEVFDLDIVTFENVLDLKKYKIELVQDQRLIKYKNLYFLHGHEYQAGASSPIYPARTLFLKAKRSAIEWHVHRKSEYTGKAINDDTTTCFSANCMCDMHPDYARLNEWSLGFAEIYTDDSGFWSIKNRRITNYRYVE